MTKRPTHEEGHGSNDSTDGPHDRPSTLEDKTDGHQSTEGRREGTE